MNIINRLVVGNWKMNGDLNTNLNLLTQLKNGAKTNNTKMVVCPPFVYLEQVKAVLGGSGIAYGAQNVSENENGAFTGEISAKMLGDINCTYCIIGHSERRTIYKECDFMVANKTAKLLAVNITPILCVGETLAERDAGKTNEVVLKQLKAVVDFVGIAKFTKIVVAYEPVWAIGTGKTATPEMAEAVHKTLREFLISQNPEVGNTVPLLYGGSVKGDNAKSLFAMPNINGGLIGGAALKAEDFLAIVNA